MPTNETAMRTPRIGPNRRLLLASNNRDKLREYRRIFDALGVSVLSPNDLGIDLRVDEHGSTFAANATLKAEAFRDAAGCLVLADDSGLMVDALGGEPGVRSARYGGPGLDDAGRIALVLERLSGVPATQRTARFVAAIAVAEPGIATVWVEASVEGEIADGPRGYGGFGYDPIFFYSPLGRTFAELEPAEKEQVSHRGKAARRVAKILIDEPDAGYT